MTDDTAAQNPITTLVAKLNAMELTDDERAVLKAVFSAAADNSEVVGFDLNLGSVTLFAAPETSAAPRDASTGMATGRRQYEPLRIRK